MSSKWIVPAWHLVLFGPFHLAVTEAVPVSLSPSSDKRPNEPDEKCSGPVSPGYGVKLKKLMPSGYGVNAVGQCHLARA